LRAHSRAKPGGLLLGWRGTRRNPDQSAPSYAASVLVITHPYPLISVNYAARTRQLRGAPCDEIRRDPSAPGCQRRPAARLCTR
jgi:hypothetical protein